MASIRGGDTRPELIVRRLLHRCGYRYRVRSKDLPGKPDLVFRSRRKVVFVNGCFWHQHASRDCHIVKMPKSNLDYWQPKLARTVERDARTLKILQDQGWEVVTVWECELKDLERLERRLRAFLD